MLMVLKPGKEAMAKAIFDKWDLDAEVIGFTTDTGRLVLKQQGEVVCDIPVSPLSNDAPNYDRPWNPPKAAPALDISKFPEPADYGEVLLRLMSSPDMASKRWIWEQYDRHVMGDTLDSSQSGGDAAIVRIHGTNKALAICSDCNPHYVAADPYEGGKQAVAEAYRNLSAVGATPIAITDNLNFGNPEKPDTMGVIVKAIEGMAEACRALDFPVVSGNVSLYNETDGVGIPPTPVVGGVGLIEDVSKVATLTGAQPGDMLVQIGVTRGHLGASLYARIVLGLDGSKAGAPPAVDLALEKLTSGFVREAVGRGLASSMHDVAEGGIACAIAEMALASVARKLTFRVIVNDCIVEPSLPRPALQIFAEDQARLVATVSQQNWPSFSALASQIGVRTSIIGGVFAEPEPALQFWNADDEGDKQFTLALAALRDAHEGWLPGFMSGRI
jgi:phosphoribosylformylglycinamidine synthase